MLSNIEIEIYERNISKVDFVSNYVVNANNCRQSTSSENIYTTRRYVQFAPNDT